MDNFELEQRCNVLRKELKAWEKAFASQHEGRKAGRDDIKANAVVSQKYKEYNKARDVLSGRAAPQTPSKRPATRKAAADAERTPKARARSLDTTPMKRKRDSGVGMADEDAAAEIFSPEGPSMIGPTPQRNGIVLGLFDLLPADTPSKKRTVLAEVVPNVLQTPSKNTAKAENETSLESRARGERTPQSSSKRFMLDRFVTPKKRKLDDGTGMGTPTSSLKGFSTPAFLRRDTLLDVVNEEDEATPRPAPWKRRGLGRSLSSMIRGMKQQEEDRLDEEAELMREFEMEAEGIVVAKKGKLEKVLVGDSQVVMPLGPDRGLESEEDDDKENEEGANRRAWKKKGLKRQTRRVNMRPHFVKPLVPQPADAVEEDSDTEAAVAETQLPAEPEASDHDLSDDGSDYASDNSHTPKQRKAVQQKKSAAKEEKAGVVKTAARKVKATAHANYRKLKIKGKGGNGAGPGGRGRFGRRR